MLRDLTVQNYRCFDNFHIDGLEQVNLFVGNNNSGKTSLLEAIYLLVNSDKKATLMEIIDNRTTYFFDDDTLFYSVNHLFYGRNVNQQDKIKIASNQSVYQQIILNFFYINQEKYSFEHSRKSLQFSEEYSVEAEEDNKIIKKTNKNNIISLENEEYIEINRRIKRNNYMQTGTKISNCIFVSINKFLFDKVTLMWDAIDLTPKENKIIEALKIIDSNLERISFSSSNNANLIRLKLKNIESPIPLSSMGDGMYRILTLAMSLVTAEDGVLLVDEIETGLHYEAQTDMWRLILETAKELNVQVFATTHSWDCIAAFQEALSQVENKSIGKLFRLDSKYGKLRAVEYDADDLDVATREGIEVR